MVFGNKKIFKKLGEIHVGNNAQKDF